MSLCTTRPLAFGAIWRWALFGGGVVGVVCAWPYSTAWGVVLGSIASILVMLGRGLIGLDVDVIWLALIGLALGTPAAVSMIPAMFALRWAINMQADWQAGSATRREKLRTPLILLALIAVLGILSLYPARARSVLRSADQTITAGLAMQRADELPYELAHLRSGDFLRDAGRRFDLEWTQINLDRFIELRPANNYEEHSAVIAHFDNGNTLVCLYPTATGRPNCAFLSL